MGDDRAHSIYAPSSSHRWLECPKSIVHPDENIPEPPVMKVAIEGTDAHFVGEQCLKSGLDAMSMHGARLPSGAKCTVMMAKYVQKYLNYIRRHFDANGGTWSIEERLAMAKLDAEMFGSADVIQITKYRTLHVFDLKYGMWVVEPENNTQMMCYAIGALAKYKHLIDLTKPVTAHICQPRPTHEDGPFRVAKFTIDQLIEFGKDVRKAIAVAKDPNCGYKAGDHCALCKREFLCPELNKLGRKIFV